MGTDHYVPRHAIPLESGTGFARPRELPELVSLDDPAIDVMTDFQLIRPVTVRSEVSIERALGGMKAAGVRLLLVTDDADSIIGLVTADDLQGAKPIKLTEQQGLARADLTVAMVMMPQADITVLDMRSARDSQVGHIVATLEQLERQHVLVVDVDAASGRQEVRGLFSTSQITKQLGHKVVDELHAAHSLAEMVWEIR